MTVYRGGLRAAPSSGSGRRNSHVSLQITDGTQEAVCRCGLRIDQTVQTKAVLQREQNRAGPCGVQGSGLPAVLQRDLDDISDLFSSGSQALGEVRSALFGTRHKQDHLHVQKRRTAERILSATIHGPQRLDKIREVLVSGEKIKIAPNGLFDVILEHGDDQLVLALEIRIKRPAREAGRSRDAFDAGAADSLFLEDARRRLKQLFAGIVPSRSGSNSRHLAILAQHAT